MLYDDKPLHLLCSLKPYTVFTSEIKRKCKSWFDLKAKWIVFFFDLNPQSHVHQAVFAYACSELAKESVRDIFQSKIWNRDETKKC